MVGQIKQQVTRLVRDEEGASMVEYILLIALIAAVCIVGFTTLGNKTSATVNGVADKINPPK
jgi:pilus assembly protein Flp/PilA